MKLGERLYRAYANLAMAHAAVRSGDARYGQRHYMIRARLQSGLTKGTMNTGSLLDDERVKLTFDRACAYCGFSGELVIDHLIARSRGGPDTADNSVWACRSCNSSKGAKDVLKWLAESGRFPPLLLLRRYLKLAILHCEAAGLLGEEESGAPTLPFDLAALPDPFPAPADLVLWTPARSCPGE